MGNVLKAFDQDTADAFHDLPFAAFQQHSGLHKLEQLIDLGVVELSQMREQDDARMFSVEGPKCMLTVNPLRALQDCTGRDRHYLVLSGFGKGAVKIGFISTNPEKYRMNEF